MLLAISPRRLNLTVRIGWLTRASVELGGAICPTEGETSMRLDIRQSVDWSGGGTGLRV